MPWVCLENGTADIRVEKLWVCRENGTGTGPVAAHVLAQEFMFWHGPPVPPSTHPSKVVVVDDFQSLFLAHLLPAVGQVPKFFIFKDIEIAAINLWAN